MACAQPEEINKQLCCAVCFEQFKEPKVLPCLHTYCKGCLVKLVKKKGRNHIITCPECRQEVKVSSIIMKDVTCVVTNVSQYNFSREIEPRTFGLRAIMLNH